MRRTDPPNTPNLYRLFMLYKHVSVIKHFYLSFGQYCRIPWYHNIWAENSFCHVHNFYLHTSLRRSSVSTHNINIDCRISRSMQPAAGCISLLSRLKSVTAQRNYSPWNSWQVLNAPDNSAVGLIWQRQLPCKLIHYTSPFGCMLMTLTFGCGSICHCCLE